MAIVFLDAVNASLKRVRVVQGDAGELATSTVTSTATGLIATGAFTDSGRQTQIDLMIQIWQEAIHELYSLNILPTNTKDGTITLVAAQRLYDFPTDFERMAGRLQVLRGATTNLILSEYAGGYEQLLNDQPNATDFTGDPNAWTISPITRQLYLDREPTSQQAGNTYNFLYEKRIGYSSTMATELMPFSDTVADALVPVAAEGWNRVWKKEFDSTLFRNSVARAAKTVSAKQARIRYGARRG